MFKERLLNSSGVGLKLIWGFVGIALIWMMAPIAIVSTGNMGVMTTFGSARDEVYEPGLHFRFPIAQRMNLMNVQVQNEDGSGDAASKDLQSVNTKVSINFHLDPKQAVQAFKNIGPSTDIVAQRIIVPATHESVKAVTARFTAEELITRRTEVRDQISILLKEKMNRHGLVLDEFNIVNFSFSKSFSDAIELKVKAEQQKQQAERDLQRLQVEAQQKIVGAKAEAEALGLQRQQITAELLALRRIENERLAITKWNGVLPAVSGGATPFVNLEKLKWRQKALEVNQETANAIVMQLSTATGLITQGRSLGFRALATKSAMEDLRTLIFKELSTP